MLQKNLLNKTLQKNLPNKTLQKNILFSKMNSIDNGLSTQLSEFKDIQPQKFNITKFNILNDTNST